MSVAIHIIIVTHNSQRELPYCLQAIEGQEITAQTVVIVDSGSDDTTYLDGIENRCTRLIKTANIGFARANNLGVKATRADEEDIIVFLNPDAFLKPDVLGKVQQTFLELDETGCLTGKLLGYDLDKGRPTGKLDSTGVFRKWYGRWYDRGHGEIDSGKYDRVQQVPAVCGAFMCCMVKALREFGYTVFDEDFFMYKEDIELSLRVRKHGYTLWYLPQIEVYHCRGWAADRKKMSYNSRELSARNEWQMYKKHPSPYIVWALAKLCAVRFLRF